MDASLTLAHLSDAERDCLLRYLSVLAERLGKNLVQV
jgi:hypothetical protein